MKIEKITATNKRGDSITFTNPLRLIKVDGLSGLNANNFYVDSTRDGSTRTGMKLANRNIEIEFRLMKKVGFTNDTIEDYGMLLNKVFNPKQNPIRFDITTKAGRKYYLHANADTAPLLPVDNNAYVSGLLQFSCDDPYIYSYDEHRVDIAVWLGAFEFPLEIPANEGIEMGYRSESLFANVVNDGQTETGMLIRFKALGTVVNPSLINVNTLEFLKLNITLEGGDVLEVSTYTGNKYIRLNRNGVISNAFNALDLDSTFLQLDIGDNIFRYDADENLENLEVDIRFRNLFVGV